MFYHNHKDLLLIKGGKERYNRGIRSSVFVPLGPEAENEWWSKEKEEKKEEITAILSKYPISPSYQDLSFSPFVTTALKMKAVSFLGCIPMAPACGTSLNPLLIQSHKASQHPFERRQYH